MLEELGIVSTELSILLTDDPTIRGLNRQHRRKDKPTDVLSFPMDGVAPGPKAPSLLGDIAISLDTAGRQARQRGHGLLDEVTHLLAHGLLHLLGYDHRTDREEKLMNQAANRLIVLFPARDRARAKLSPDVRDHL